MLNRTVAHGFGPACGVKDMRGGSAAAAAIDLKSAAFQPVGKGRAKRGGDPSLRVASAHDIGRKIRSE